MSDRTYACLEVTAPPQIVQYIEKWIVPEYFGGSDDDDDPAMPDRWAACEVCCGSANQINNALLELMTTGFDGDGDPAAAFPAWPFAFQVHEDPKYEWLGELYLYVPTDGEPLHYATTCDSEGQTVINGGQIDDLVDKATSLEELTAALRKLTGKPVWDAWAAYTFKPLPEQDTLPLETTP